MRFFVFLLLVFTASAVAPEVSGQKNLGFYLFPEFTYSMSLDCENATIELVVMDANMTAVENATSLLSYVEDRQILISKNSTGPDGHIMHYLPGNVSYMRGLFVLLIEKNSWRSKEIYFDISPCYSDKTVPAPVSSPPAAEPETEAAEEEIIPEAIGKDQSLAEDRMTDIELYMPGIEKPEGPGNLLLLPIGLGAFFIMLILVRAQSIARKQTPLDPKRKIRRKYKSYKRH